MKRYSFIVILSLGVLAFSRPSFSQQPDSKGAFIPEKKVKQQSVFGDLGLNTSELLKKNRELKVEYALLKKEVADFQDLVVKMEKQQEKIAKDPRYFKKQSITLQEDMLSLKKENDLFKKELVSIEKQYDSWQSQLRELKSREKVLIEELKYKGATYKEFSSKQIGNKNIYEDVVSYKFWKEKMICFVQEICVFFQNLGVSSEYQHLKDKYNSLVRLIEGQIQSATKERNGLKEKIEDTERQIEEIRKNVEAFSVSQRKKRELVDEMMKLDKTNQTLRQETERLTQTIAVKRQK